MTKSNLNISNVEALKIPYLRVYEEEGVFELKPNFFSKTYYMHNINPEIAKHTDIKTINQKFAILLNLFDEKTSLQFTIHNKLIDQKEYLKSIFLRPDKTDTLNNVIREYDTLLAENVEIGHNNIKKDKYFTITRNADIVDDAIDFFKEVNNTVKKLFYGICEIEVDELSVIDRMRVLHSIYNPHHQDHFGSKADLGNGTDFSLKNMNYMKLTTKDIIAAEDGIKEEKTYFILNKNTYGRSLFINNLPSHVSENLISDLTNISSNMLFTVTYESINSESGFDIVASLVKENTNIIETSSRKTVVDRKNKNTIKTETKLVNNEDTYFHEKALEVFKSAVASQEKVLVCSFIITIFADSLDDLDRDTSLLRIAESKFLCQLKTLDLQQLSGFNSSLPLGICKVDVKRTFNISKVSNVSPLGISEVLKRNGLYYGLNSINDNLVLLNRKNNQMTNGIISGGDYSGKTFQLKREILNALIGSNDKVYVITNNHEYKEFTRNLGGIYVTENYIDIFHTVDDYGLREDKKIFKTTFIRALLSAEREIWGALNEKTRIEKTEIWNNEMDNLESYLFQRECATNLQEVKDFLITSGNTKELLKCLENVEKKYYNLPLIEPSTFTVFYGEDITRILILLDHIWNEMIHDKKRNISTWLFIDGADELLKLEEISDYTLDYLDKCNQSKTITTLSFQSAIRLFNDSSVTFEMLLEKMGYVKLLNQGPIERKRFADIYNIPNSLLKYITNVEPSEGLIITATSNIAFFDRSIDESEENFYDMFKKKDYMKL